MKFTKTFTKQEIVEAIKKGELNAGSWTMYNSDNAKDCRTCAIGAVFQDHLLKHYGADTYECHNDEMYEKLTEENYSVDSYASYQHLQETVRENAKTFNGVFEDLEDDYKQNKFNEWSAISILFETASYCKHNYGTKISPKELCIKFIENNFPDTVQVEV